MWRTGNHNQYLVRKHNPRRLLIVRGLVLLVLLGTCWTLFEYGRSRGGYDRTQAKSESEALTQKISILNARIDELMAENAHLSSSSEIDATASREISGKLTQLNEEMLELKEELVFYRSLLAPAEMGAGLQILGIQMVKDSGGNAYNYKIVLTQRHNRNQLVTGDIDVQFTGTQFGRQLQLSLGQLANEGDNELSFRFKNFQSLEGKLTLPENFEPKDILVNVNPTTRGIKQIEQAYEWDKIISGG